MQHAQTFESTVDIANGNPLIARLEGLGANLFGNSPAPASPWYAGLAIEPTDFSRQLARLQVSLHKAAGQPETNFAGAAELIEVLVEKRHARPV